MGSLKELDKEYIWHPFDQMKGADILPIVRGEDSSLFDENGNEYIDGFSSWWVNAHGHSNKYIANKITEQLKVLEHVAFGGFTHPQAVRLAERIVGITPSNIKKVFFSDNGSTANEVALKMSIQYWKNKGKVKDQFISFSGDYHGDTFGSMSLTSRGGFNEPFEQFMFDVVFIAPPDNELPDLKVFEDHLKSGRVAAFIFEPLVQGACGMKMHNAKGLSDMIRLAKKYGVLTIADEVFTGFGRTGRWFACDHLTEEPDVMCLSKALYGIVQGGVHKDLREESIDFNLNKVNVFGIAIGGSLGSTKQEMHNIVNFTGKKIGFNHPIHLLGIGDPKDIWSLVKSGIDTFDCVNPTRLARHGSALIKSSKGRININNLQYSNNKKPIDLNCLCETCKNFSLSYLHHLLKTNELLGLQLLTLHNIFFMNKLMKIIRDAIEKDKLEEAEKEWYYNI